MKLKLVALLFSQAASDLTMDKSNYKQHLCDEQILRPSSITYEAISPFIQSGQESAIMGDYQYYCMVRSYYDEAVENKKTATWRTHKPCGGNQKDLIEPSKCVETQGILYAQACEKMKQDRDSMPSAWNAIIPTLVSCNNM